MKIAVRYQSRGGNTKAVARIIAKELEVQAFSVDTQLEEYVDVLFLGGGVYEWRMDKSLRQLLEKLNPQNVGQIICFSTTGYMNSTNRQIRQIAEEKGIQVNEKELLIKMLLKGHSWLGLEGGHLSEKHISEIHGFVEMMRKEML